MLSQGLHRVGLSMRIAREDVLARLYRAEEANPDRQVPTELARRWASSTTGRVVGVIALRQLIGRRQVRCLEPGTLSLSESGRVEARELVRSHRLWESYLSEHFDLPADHLHDPAERIEHFIGPGLRAELEVALDRPDADPHGRAIPSGHLEEGVSSDDPGSRRNPPGSDR
jgi:hypothetical protein